MNTTEEHLSSCLESGESREHGKEMKTANVDISAILASRKILGGALQDLPSYSGDFMTQKAASWKGLIITETWKSRTGSHAFISERILQL
jgi:hypothetical protein